MKTFENYWLKTSVFTFILVGFLGAPQAHATPDYVGTWCQKYDDFTRVMIINADDELEEFHIGNQAGEKVPSVYGFVSQGASGFQVNINGEDMGVVDYKVSRFLGKKSLIFKHSSGQKDRYSSCSVKVQ